MARVLVTVTPLTRLGSDVATLKDTGVADGNNFPNNGKTLIMVTSVGGTTLTIPIPRTVDDLAVADYTLALGAGEVQMAGPFPTTTFNQSDGTVHLDWTDETALTFEAVSL